LFTYSILISVKWNSIPADGMMWYELR